MTLYKHEVLCHSVMKKALLCTEIASATKVLRGLLLSTEIMSAFFSIEKYRIQSAILVLRGFLLSIRGYLADKIPPYLPLLLFCARWL